MKKLIFSLLFVATILVITIFLYNKVFVGDRKNDYPEHGGEHTEHIISKQIISDNTGGKEQHHKEQIIQSTVLENAVANISTAQDTLPISSQIESQISDIRNLIRYMVIDPENDPEGIKWSNDLSILDVKLMSILENPTFSRDEKIYNLWNLFDSLDYGTPASYVIDTLSKLYPIEIADKIIDAFQFSASQGDNTTVRQLELLGLLKSSLDISSDNLNAQQQELLLQARQNTKDILSQQIYSHTNANIFKESLSIYYAIAELSEVTKTFSSIASAIADDPNLKQDFYSTWTQSIFARKDLQPAVEILYNQKNLDEVNTELYKVLKNYYSEDISDNLKNGLYSYLKSQQPSMENAQSYVAWLNAYISIQSTSEASKNILLSDFVSSDLSSNSALRAHAIKSFGVDTILSNLEDKEVTLLIHNLQNSENSLEYSDKDKSIITDVLSEIRDHININ